MSDDHQEPTPAEPLPAPAPPQQPQRTRLEKIFLGAIILSTMLAAIGFVLGSTIQGYGFPSTFVAILLGVCVATLAYSFLGGGSGAVFKLGGFELAGAAAVIMVVVYAVKGPLSADMNDVRHIRIGRDAEQLLEHERQAVIAERRARRDAERQVEELRGQAGDMVTESVSAIIGRIGQSSADQPLGRGVLDLFHAGRGPFNPVLGTVRLPVRFNADVRRGTYRFCHGRRAQLQGRPVRFELVDRQAGTSRRIQLDPGEDIGQGICSEINFDVLLGCDAVDEILTGAVASCDARSGIGWVSPHTNSNFELVATILNPALLPRSESP